MAEPDSASIAISSMKSGLKELLVKVCGAEQRTRLLSTLLRLKLLTKDVKNFSRKQLMQQRNQVQRGLGNMIFQSGKNRMMNKIASSRLEEKKLRKKRDLLRNKLEDQVSKNVFS